MKARSTGKSTVMSAHIFIINNWNQYTKSDQTTALL